jgi:hypothetical protein
MLIDLRNLKKRLDVEEEIDRTSSPETPVVTVGGEIDRTPQQRRVLAIALIGMAVATAAIFGFSIWRASRTTTTVSVTTPPATAIASEERTLTYWITVQKFRNNRAYEPPFTVPGEINFEADYQIRVHFSSPQAGYLYIVNEGPREASAPPQFVVLFPSSTANEGSPWVAANQTVQIPEESWFKFDNEQGTEKLWLVFSSDAVPELEAVKEFVSNRTQGLITDSAKSQSVQNFLTAHSVQKPTAETGDKQTTLKSPGKLLVYPVKLEHH